MEKPTTSGRHAISKCDVASLSKRCVSVSLWEGCPVSSGGGSFHTKRHGMSATVPLEVSASPLRTKVTSHLKAFTSFHSSITSPMWKERE